MGRQEHDSVDAYIEDQPEVLAGVVRELRALVLGEAPDAVVESIKWGHPNYETDGNICYISAYSQHVNLGFFRGVDLEDPDGLLDGSGKKLRHVKVWPEKRPPEQPLRTLVLQAFQLGG